MKQGRPTQFRGPVARDFGSSGMPKAPDAGSGFGHGYTIGFFSFFASVVGSFLAFFLADSRVAQARAVGSILMSFGAAFTFAVVYTLVTRKGIPWAVSVFGCEQSGVLDRHANRIIFWAVSLIILLISLLLVGGGIWVVIHAADVAALQQQHGAR